MVASPFYSQANERYLRAGLLVAANRQQEALRWYSSFREASLYDLVYLAPSHLRRAEIYERLGEREKAALHYRRFVELWSDADPELRSMVEHAEAHLASLAGEAPGR